MKVRSFSNAFTLVEMVAALGISGLVATILLQTLWNGAVLFAKNSAINIAHQQARVGVMMIENDLHSSTSVPQLIDANRNPISGLGPAPGIAFHSFAGGPYQVAPGDYMPTQNTISVLANGGTPPAVNQRLNIETHNVELYITAVAATGGKYTLTLSGNLPNEVNTTLMGQAVNIPCFTTEQAAYLVQGSQLLKYPKRGSSNFIVLSQGITSATPFSIPQTQAGAPYNRFVAAVNLVCADAAVAQLDFKSANMYLNSMVPYRSRLTQTQ